MKKIHTRRLWKLLLFLLADMLSVGVALLLTHALTVRVLPLPERYSLWVLISAALPFVVYALFGLYNTPVYTAGFFEMVRSLGAICSIAVLEVLLLLLGRCNHWISMLLYVFLLFGALLLSRFSGRLLRVARLCFAAKKRYIPVMIVGGGDAGTMIIKELKKSEKVNFYPVCVIDDDPAKLHTRIEGVPVVGNRHKIGWAVTRYSVKRIYITMPAVSGKDMKEISGLCAATGCKVQVLPGIVQILDTPSTRQLREVDIHDLLGREPMVVSSEEVRTLIRGRRVLVTGGGGSIGSELCRQIAMREPAELVIFDIYENNAYDIEMELRHDYPQLCLRVLIGSVRDEKRVNDLFATTRPQLVFHAAAHKHVPLMENSPNEAVKNNVFGTWNVARAADAYGVDRFVLISTDKAVNPTNIMGSTKRICEMIVQYMSRHAKHTEYAAVRFGNVLGSNGSVIPLFKKQIQRGGPVCVTHKDIIRYFMTIPEAVALVLQAGTYARGGEIFILDMGEPVKILTLAENLIRLSGYKPYDEIPIAFTGLRPGEKLYDELLMAEEGMKSTANHRIHIGRPIEFDEEEFLRTLDRLKEQMQDDKNDLRPLIRVLVPTFHTPEPEQPSAPEDC